MQQAKPGACQQGLAATLLVPLHHSVRHPDQASVEHPARDDPGAIPRPEAGLQHSC